MSRFLLHTYTRRIRTAITDTGTGDPATDPGVDDWNQPKYTWSAAEPGIPCFYEIKGRIVVTPQGLMTINQPRVIVASDDPLAEGDLVSNIRIRNINRTVGPVIFPGNYVVEDIWPQDPTENGSLFNEAYLRQPEIVPTTLP